MLPEHALHFGAYQLDGSNEQLWRGKRPVRLTGKAFAVLRYLLARPGQLVTKEECFRALWPATVVSDAALTRCIQELRKVLRDDAKAPRYIETVHRRGFRFIAPITPASQPVSSFTFQVSRSLPSPAPSTQHPAPVLVGREVELGQLHGWLETALGGERQLVFVTGEAGIGKTTVVEAFLQNLASTTPGVPSQGVQTLDSGHQTLDARLWIARGQCVEHYGAGEAYMPVLEALGRLCQGPEGERFIEILRQHAPTWLVQMPALLSAREREKLQRQVMGAVRERMLREIAEALEVLTAGKGLVLWFEDLQWSDVSTLDLLAVLGRRRERARLLVVGTYRPVDVIVSDHPLRGIKQELHVHGRCQELALDFLTEAAVGEYLAVRFPAGATGRSPLQQLARVLHQRTDGNPLFMVTAVDHLVGQGLIVHADGRWALKGKAEEVGVWAPASIQQLIEQRLERLGPETQRLLEVASVGGAEFSAAAVAAGLETEVETVEGQREALVRRQQFLRARGTEE